MPTAGNVTAPAPLEAVLLVAALANNLRRRALDLTSPQTLSFEDNEARTTGELTNLLKSRPDILSKLDGTGVFIVGEQLSEISRQVVALNFAKATEVYQIQGLP